MPRLSGPSADGIDTSVDTDAARKHAGRSVADPQPAPAITGCIALSTSASVVSYVPPLSTIAAANRPLDSGDATWISVSCAPADSPNNSTRSGAPPKSAMLFFTHVSAAI